MGLLITDLLKMAQHSRTDMHPEWVDLSALALQVVAELERGEPQRQVQWDIQPGLRVQADPTLMRVVLQNLLGNAWKYTGQVADARIRLHGTRSVSDGQVGFCVSDNGAGFDMPTSTSCSSLSSACTPTSSLKAPALAWHGGAGVQRHGGRVHGKGAVGQGASFCVSLPLEPVSQFDDSGNSVFAADPPTAGQPPFKA